MWNFPCFSHFVIKTLIQKNLDSLQSFTTFFFQNCQKRERTLQICNVIVTWLLCQFWIVNNLLGKNLIRKFFLNYFSPSDIFLVQKIPAMYGEWNNPIFREPVMSEFHIRGTFLPFWINLVQKIKIVCLRWYLVTSLIWFCWIPWWCSFFLFKTGSALFGQISSKQFKFFCLSLNLVPRLIWIREFRWCNIHFFLLRPEITNLGKFGPKICGFLFEMKIDTFNNLNMRNSKTIFIFSALDQEYPWKVGSNYHKCFLS